jgi:hypothetical protein
MVLAPTLTLNSVFARGYDADALAYIQSVETADGDTLESGVRVAIDNFVRGCKTDGIWDAIKSSAILAGARTLSGALQPLVGVAPTNFNFVSGDYNRKTGLVGDGATKYLNSNRNNNADPQNSKHLSFYVVTPPAIGATRALTATTYSAGDTSLYYDSSGNLGGQLNSHNPTWSLTGAGVRSGFIGQSRSSSSVILTRAAATNVSHAINSVSPKNETLPVFSGPAAYYSDARLFFYSIGESLDLALLDARVTSLINAYAAEIP